MMKVIKFGLEELNRRKQKKILEVTHPPVGNFKPRFLPVAIATIIIRSGASLKVAVSSRVEDKSYTNAIFLAQLECVQLRFPLSEQQ